MRTNDDRCRPLTVRNVVCGLIVFSGLLLSCGPAQGLEIIDYLSPWNKERPVRPATFYIVLHTTEGANAGSLTKIHDNGEAHFFIDTAGRVYRTIQEKRLALHAGRSIWDGKQNVDNYSIGIEVVGYYNKDITSAQYKSLKELLKRLQDAYKIPDKRVLTHSMVAYGAPNTWHKQAHRGRKRCGMLFARDSVRERIGLESKTLEDPDVKAGRVVVGDPYLAQVLYGATHEQEKAVERYTAEDASVISKKRSAWDIARDRYKGKDTVYTYPDGRERRGNEIKDWKKVPMGTKISFASEQSDDAAENILEVGVDGDDAVEVAGDSYKSSTTIYFLPDGQVKKGTELSEKKLLSLPEKTRVLVGYRYGGTVTAKRSAFQICGKAWNYPSTFYKLPDATLVSGNKLNQDAIPKNALVFFRE